MSWRNYQRITQVSTLIFCQQKTAMISLINRVQLFFSAIPEKTSPGKKVLSFIKSLRPVMTFDPLTGQPQFSFDLKDDESSRQIEALLHKEMVYTSFNAMGEKFYCVYDVLFRRWMERQG